MSDSPMWWVRAESAQMIGRGRYFPSHLNTIRLNELARCSLSLQRTGMSHFSDMYLHQLRVSSTIGCLRCLPKLIKPWLCPEYIAVLVIRVKPKHESQNIVCCEREPGVLAKWRANMYKIFNICPAGNMAERWDILLNSLSDPESSYICINFLLLYGKPREEGSFSPLISSPTMPIPEPDHCADGRRNRQTHLQEELPRRAARIEPRYIHSEGALQTVRNTLTCNRYCK